MYRLCFWVLLHTPSLSNIYMIWSNNYYEEGTWKNRRDAVLSYIKQFSQKSTLHSKEFTKNRHQYRRIRRKVYKALLLQYIISIEISAVYFMRQSLTCTNVIKPFLIPDIGMNCIKFKILTIGR